ncbi:multicopper oxidase, partial [Aureobasidium melanogenum]
MVSWGRLILHAFSFSPLSDNGLAAIYQPDKASFAIPAPQPPKNVLGGINAASFHGPAFVSNGMQSLQNALGANQQDGNSSLGSFDAPTLPPFLTSGGTPLPFGFPWGQSTANNTNYYNTTPNTGVTRYYNFEISAGRIAPDGVFKDGILVNGQFPGPTIEANWGDMISVTVTNSLDEGTSLHWHGLLQKATPWFDGVPSIMQCPIAPGKSFTYVFQADLYGTSWYHSHFSAHYAGGAAGAMVIYGPKNVDYDIDLGPVILSDWYHEDYYTLVEQTMSKASDKTPQPASNNNLINGKMNFPCYENVNCTANAGVSKFPFTSGKKHRLRLINMSAEAMQKFSIDGHKMTVIANDFVPVEPYEVSVVTLGVGQRTDIIVEADGSPTDSVWMRSNIKHCSLTDGTVDEAVAAIYYENADNTTIPTSKSSVTTTQLSYCNNDDLSVTKPFFPITPDPNPSTTEDLVIEYRTNETDFNLWFVNNVSFRGDYNNPILLEAKLGNLDFPEENHVMNFGSNKTVRLVVYNYFSFGGHPMHMHGHNIYVLAEGFGEWDNTVTNPSNPQRRDTVWVQAAKDKDTPAYVVLQIDQDNPGVWPFHCHIAWHVSAGLYVSILERPDDIKNMNVPGVMAQSCRDWSAFTGQAIVDQIDSGL